MNLFLFVVLALQVDLRLEPSDVVVAAGSEITVELVASSAQPEVVTAIDAILAWDPERLTLLSGTPADLPTFISGFLSDPDGINLDITDGLALFTVLTPITNPGSTPPDVIVARFDFKVLRSGCVALQPEFGQFGKTRVIGPAPGVEITGSLGDPAVVEVPGAFTTLGAALAGTGGLTPALSGDGALLDCDPWTLDLIDARPSSSAWFVVGLTPLNAPLKGGTLVPSPDIIVPLATDATGSIALTGPWPAGLPGDLNAWLQYWIADPEAPVGFAASNALLVTTP